MSEPNVGFRIGPAQCFQQLPSRICKVGHRKSGTQSTQKSPWRVSPIVAARIGTQSAPTPRAANPRLRDQGVMAPPASDAATLRRHVNALQADLEAHVGNERRLLSINGKLRERLELCYNELSADNVEQQLNTLSNEMEQTLELLHQLSDRNATLEKEKEEFETVMQSRMKEFASEQCCLQAEKHSLQTHISKMSEGLHHGQSDAQNQTVAFCPIQQVGGSFKEFC